MPVEVTLCDECNRWITTENIVSHPDGTLLCIPCYKGQGESCGIQEESIPQGYRRCLTCDE